MIIEKKATYDEYLKMFHDVPLETLNNSVANWRLRNTGKKIDWREVSRCDYTAEALKTLIKGI